MKCIDVLKKLLELSSEINRLELEAIHLKPSSSEYFHSTTHFYGVVQEGFLGLIVKCSPSTDTFEKSPVNSLTGNTDLT
jgi:hypothetical protein